MRTLMKLLATSVAGAALTGCAYTGLGMGYDGGYGYNSPYGYSGYGSPYGYSNYGYPRSGVSVGVTYGSGYGGYGYGSPYGYGGYGSPYGYGSSYGYGSPYGYGSYGGYYGQPYYGWNNGYYYPGTGNYVYNSYRQPVVMTDSQRRYWSDRQRAYTKTAKVQPAVRENWSAFKAERQAARETRRAERKAEKDKR